MLTISSAIVGHKWFHCKKRDEEELHCPLQALQPEVIQRFLLDPLHKSHIVLAINSSNQAKQRVQVNADEVIRP